MNRFVAIIVGTLYAQSLLGLVTISNGNSATLNSNTDTSYTVQGGGKGIIDGNLNVSGPNFINLIFNHQCILSLTNPTPPFSVVPISVDNLLQFGATDGTVNPTINIEVQNNLSDVTLTVWTLSGTTKLINNAALTNANIGNINFVAITPGYIINTYPVLSNSVSIQIKKIGGTSGAATSGSFINATAVAVAGRASASSHRAGTLVGAAFKKALFGPDEEYLAQATDNVLPQGSVVAFARKNNHHAIWMRGVGRKSHQDPIHSFPSYEISTWGDSIGYDYMYDEGMVSGSLGYVHSFVKEGSRAGSGIINAGVAGIKGATYLPKSWFFEYGLVGSVNFNHFKRHVFNETANSSFKSYVLDPHLDVGKDFRYKDWFVFEPFLSTDFIFGFQGAYDEYGAGQYDQHYATNNTGVFRLEPGFNYFQYWMGDWGAVILREKTSYVLKQPMYGTQTTTSLLTNPGDIAVESGLFRQNLFSVSGQLFGRFRQGTFLSASYRGEWGSGFDMNELHLRIGQYF